MLSDIRREDNREPRAKRENKLLLASAAAHRFATTISPQRSVELFIGELKIKAQATENTVVEFIQVCRLFLYDLVAIPIRALV